MSSNVGKWAPWYEGATEPRWYGPAGLYEAAEEWLAGLDVEDWGCGSARFRDLHVGGYLGVDGTPGWCDVVADLETYRSSCDGLMMRAVLEHNRNWQAVLDNAVASFRRRMCLVMFISPFRERTEVLAENVGGLGVPDIGIALQDLVERFGGARWWLSTTPSQEPYGDETVIRLERP